MYCTVTAQAAIFRENSLMLYWGGKYEPWDYYPDFLPIFMPDGRVSGGRVINRLGGPEINRSAKSKYRDQTVRVRDMVTHEARFVTVEAGGQVVVSTRLPPRIGMPDTDPGVNSYVSIYPPPPPPPPPSKPSSSSGGSSSSSGSSGGTGTSSSGSGGIGVDAVSGLSAGTAGTSSGDGAGF